MKKNLFRTELDPIKPYIPGKPIEEVQRELGLEDVIKLASNENPLGPSRLAMEAMRAEIENVHIYPDGGATYMKEAISKKYGVDADRIVVSNGGEEIIKMIAEIFINPGDEAIMAKPTFTLYKNSVQLMGGVPVEVPLKDLKHDIPGFIEKINEKTKIVYVCNPNNPIGNIVERDEMELLLRNLPEEVVLVLDEAYYEYAEACEAYPDGLAILAERPNTIIIRTFSKVAGLAGVRSGYGFTSREIAANINKIRTVFNVNKLAQIGALAAMKDDLHISKTVELNRKTMDMMEAFFESHDLNYVKSYTNFVFVDLGLDSKTVFDALLSKGIIIRPGFIWGMDTWVRISSGTEAQIRRLLEALEELLAA